MEHAVRLRPEPQSAGIARAWLNEVLTRMGRLDLVDSATLAISELVTNAVLHARTGITIMVRDDVEGDVIIEVADTSKGRLQPGLTDDNPDGSPATVGLGLHIIGALVARWGVRESLRRGNEGKTVWFVPSRSAHANRPAEPDTPDVPAAPGASPGETDVVVVIRGAPVQLLWQTRFRIRDVRREMQLLALRSGSEHRVPVMLAELANEVEQLNVAVLAEDERFERAYQRDDETVTLQYGVPRSAGVTCAQLADVLDETDEYCRSARLLALAAGPDEQAMRRWFLGEFDLQVRGARPRPYPGRAGQS